MRVAAITLFCATVGCDRAGGPAHTPPAGGERPGEQSVSEIQKSKCDGGDAQSCWHVGYGYEKGVSDQYGHFPQDYGTAANYYNRGCSLGALIACDSFARLLKEGKGVARNERAAVELYVSNCERGYGWSCVFAGHAYAIGKTVDFDVDRATSYYRKACTAGIESGCSALTRALTLTLGTGKHAEVPPPPGAGGFRLGAPLQDAATACTGAGFEWQLAERDATQGRCTGVPGKVGLDFAYVNACPSGKVCEITLGKTLDPRDPNQWLSEYQAKAAVIETRYGTPSARQYKVPQECYSTFSLCLVDKRAKVIAVWTWEGGEVVVIHLQISQNQPTLWLSYATAESTRSNVNSL